MCVCCGGGQYLEEARRNAAREYARVLKPGGKLVRRQPEDTCLSSIPNAAASTRLLTQS